MELEAVVEHLDVLPDLVKVLGGCVYAVQDLLCQKKSDSFNHDIKTQLTGQMCPVSQGVGDDVPRSPRLDTCKAQRAPMYFRSGYNHGTSICGTMDGLGKDLRTAAKNAAQAKEHGVR
jgi:hypothetical protein